MIEWRRKFAFYTFFLSVSLARTRALSWITQIIPPLGASIDGTHHAGPHDPAIACLRSLALLMDGIFFSESCLTLFLLTSTPELSSSRRLPDYSPHIDSWYPPRVDYWITLLACPVLVSRTLLFMTRSRIYQHHPSIPSFPLLFVLCPALYCAVFACGSP